MSASQRGAIGVLAAGSALILMTFVIGGRAAERVFVFTGLLFPGALIALGSRQLPEMVRVLIASALSALLWACAAAILFGDLRYGVSSTVMVLGMGLLPLIVVPLIYAATFRFPSGVQRARPSGESGDPAIPRQPEPPA